MLLWPDAKCGASDQYVREAEAGFSFYFSPGTADARGHPHLTTTIWLTAPLCDARRLFQYSCAHTRAHAGTCPTQNCSPEQSQRTQQQPSCTVAAGPCDPLSGSVCCRWFEDAWRRLRVVRRSLHVFALASWCVVSVGSALIYHQHNQYSWKFLPLVCSYL